jgi:transposase-like protein
LISQVTEAVVDELQAWQHRPLDGLYLVVYIDALMVKIRSKGHVGNRAVYIAVGVRLDGSKEVLGLWVEATEGAKYWLSILEELKVRGVDDIFILCADGLKGLPQAVEAAFPKAVFQTCIVHMIRYSTRFVPWKDRREVCADLRVVYTAANEQEALQALDAFEQKWDERFPMIAKSWRARWAEITPFLEYPPEIRTAVYTTNAVEALNRQLRKVLKTKGHLPSDQSALKLIFLAIRNAEKKWGMRSRAWSNALAKFAIIFDDRMPVIN